MRLAVLQVSMRVKCKRFSITQSVARRRTTRMSTAWRVSTCPLHPLPQSWQGVHTDNKRSAKTPNESEYERNLHLNDVWVD